MIVENQVGVTRYNLIKIGEAGDSLASAFFSNKFPEELDSDLMSYRTFIQRDELP